MPSASQNNRRMQLVLWNFVRNNFEQKEDAQKNVPVALKYLMSEYCQRIYDSKILLSHEEDMKFEEFIQTELPYYYFVFFLFRSSDHGYDLGKFHELCDKWRFTITIIQCKNGNIFGGYTSTRWIPDSPDLEDGSGFKKDEDAFLFLWKSQDEEIQRKCPLTFELLKDDIGCAIYCHPNMGPSWGLSGDLVIGINWNDQNNPQNWSKLVSYQNNQIWLARLCGGEKKEDLEFPDDYQFEMAEFEVFHMAH